MKMKVIGALPLPSWRWLMCALVLGAAVAVSVPALAQTIIAKEYNFSPDYVYSITFDSANRMWAKPSTASVISLDPASNVLTKWTHSNPAVFGNGVRQIGVDEVSQPGTLFAWAGAGDHINRLNTSTGEVLSWTLPSGSTCGDFVRVDGSGNAWFGKSDSRIARLEPSTNTITEWAVPIGTTCPQVIDVDAGQVWVCEANQDKIGVLDSVTNVITEWEISGANFNDCHARDSAGRLWFSRATDEILRLDPATDQLTVWTCPIGCGTVRGVARESAGEVWFAEYSPGRVASLDPATGNFVEYGAIGNCSYSNTRPFVAPSSDVWLTRNSYYVCTFPAP